ncbi:MAG TPA: outer membrane beta-barrel protein [Thermoanaerobaculia bacterium]|nr:outer membrane beta-barrel protein [Thermoanaerobaculia bacterium]
MKLRTLSLAAVALLAASSLFGQIREGTVELEPFGGYLFGGTFARGTTTLFQGRVDVADAPIYGGRVGYNATSLFEAEFQYSYTPSNFETTNSGGVFGPGATNLGDLTIQYFLGYATFNFGHSRVVPYVTIGAGAATLRPTVAGVNASSDTRFTASFGGGIKWFINPHFGLRFDGRAYTTSLGTTRYHNCDPYGCSNESWLTNGSVDGGILIAF